MPSAGAAQPWYPIVEWENKAQQRAGICQIVIRSTGPQSPLAHNHHSDAAPEKSHSASHCPPKHMPKAAMGQHSQSGLLASSLERGRGGGRRMGGFHLCSCLSLLSHFLFPTPLPLLSAALAEASSFGGGEAGEVNYCSPPPRPPTRCI